MQISDIGPMVTLPASQDCFKMTVLSQKETIIPKAQCDQIKRKAVFLTIEDWIKQRLDIQKNCQLAQCKQLVGAVDGLFLALDAGLKKVLP